MGLVQGGPSGPDERPSTSEALSRGGLYRDGVNEPGSWEEMREQEYEALKKYALTKKGGYDAAAYKVGSPKVTTTEDLRAREWAKCIKCGNSSLWKTMLSDGRWVCPRCAGADELLVTIVSEG